MLLVVLFLLVLVFTLEAAVAECGQLQGEWTGVSHRVLIHHNVAVLRRQVHIT